MPCDELIEEFEQFYKVNGQQFVDGQRFMVVNAENPFAKAVEAELSRRGIRVVSEVRMYSKDKLTVQVDMAVADQNGNLTRSREVLELLIEELHDMAVKFLPKIDPNKPLTFAEMRKHFHPKAPKDLTDKPVPEMVRKFVEVPLGDTYGFKEVYEVREPPPIKEEEEYVEGFTEAEIRAAEAVVQQMKKGQVKNKK